MAKLLLPKKAKPTQNVQRRPPDPSKRGGNHLGQMEPGYDNLHFVGANRTIADAPAVFAESDHRKKGVDLEGRTMEFPMP